MILCPSRIGFKVITLNSTTGVEGGEDGVSGDSGDEVGGVSGDSGDVVDEGLLMIILGLFVRSPPQSQSVHLHQCPEEGVGADGFFFAIGETITIGIGFGFIRAQCHFIYIGYTISILIEGR